MATAVPAAVAGATAVSALTAKGYRRALSDAHIGGNVDGSRDSPRVGVGRGGA